jgi:hypothetical protein
MIMRIRLAKKIVKNEREWWNAICKAVKGESLTNREKKLSLRYSAFKVAKAKMRLDKMYENKNSML